MKLQIRSLLAFAGTSVGALLIGLLFPMIASIEKIIIVVGYASIALCFGIFLYALYQSGIQWKPLAASAKSRDNRGPILAVLGTTLWLLSIEPFMFKVVADELLIASNAQGMHLARAPAIPQYSNWTSGHFLLLDSFLDKRPFLLPFLVSILHDLTGYRIGNVFILNAGLTLAFLTTGYAIVSRVAKRPAGYFFLLLMGFFPVLAQGATSGNASVLNITLVAGSLYLGLRYFEKPDKASLVPLVYGLLLLAQARYESALYVLPFGILILLGWKKAGEPIITPSIIIAPLFLILNLLHHRYTLEYGGFYWQAGPRDGRGSTFSMDYILGNLEGIWDFLFTLGFHQPNSIILSVIGISALFLLLFAYLRKRLAGNELVLFAIALALFLTNLAVVLFFNYGIFTYQATSRLSMPMHFFLALFAALAFRTMPKPLLQSAILLFLFICLIQTLGYNGYDWKEKGWYVTTGLIIVVTGGIFLLRRWTRSPMVMVFSLLVLSLAVMAPKMRAKHYFYDYPFSHKFQYFLDFIEENGGRDVLFLSRLPYMPSLLEQNSLSPVKFLVKRDEVTDALLDGHYRKIYLLHSISPEEEKDMRINIPGLDSLLPDLDIQLVEQRRIATGHMVFVHEFLLADSVLESAETESAEVESAEVESTESP